MSERGMVIIGAGMAGARAVIGLRANGWDGSITLIGEETLFPYDRPPLSKAMLVDDDLAIIGSANFDQRSFRLNFEAAVCLRDQSICHELEQVMHSDLESSVEVEPKAWRERSVWQRLPEAFARLMSPLL